MKDGSVYGSGVSGWALTYKTLFGRKLDDLDVQEWERLLTKDFRRGVGTDRGWQESELLAAFAAIREATRKQGKKAYPPDYGETKTIIIRNRRSGNDYSRPMDPGPKEPRCPFCRDSGAMSYWPEILSPYPTDMDQYMTKCRVVAIYCNCEQGRLLMCRDKQQETPGLRRAQQMGQDQFRSFMDAGGFTPIRGVEEVF